MKKKHAKTINDFEQKNQMNQQKNLYHQKNDNKHYLYATINLEDSIETNNNENIKENYIFQTNGNIYIKSKEDLKNQNFQTPTSNKRPINSRDKNKKKILSLKKMNIFSKVPNDKNNYFRNKYGNEVIMMEEENKEVTKEEEKKDKDNGCERPEDISDYINIDNIDEEDYNIYKTLTRKIENEAIEEVEEAKESSELRQSSEFYNNISGPKSNLKKNTKHIWTKKNIYQQKGSNKKIEDNNSLFSKYLTFNKKEIYNKSNKIISRVGYKKSKKNFSSHKSSLNSDVTINSNEHKTTMNFEIPDCFFNKSNRDNLIFKKNYHIIKDAYYKNRTSNNSKNNCIIYLKNKKNEYLNNKEENKIKKIILKFEYNRQREIPLKSKNMRKLDKNKKTSQTVPNLKQFYNNKNKENRDGINCLKKIINIYNNGNKERTENSENKYIFFEESKFKSMKSNKISKDYHIKRNEFYGTSNKYCKLFYSGDKSNKLNKTNDRIKVPIKIYNNYFNDDDKTRAKKGN